MLFWFRSKEASCAGEARLVGHVHANRRRVGTSPPTSPAHHRSKVRRIYNNFLFYIRVSGKRLRTVTFMTFKVFLCHFLDSDVYFMILLFFFFFFFSSFTLESHRLLNEGAGGTTAGRAVLMDETAYEKSLICFPFQKNLHNKMFGGYLMRKAYEAAFANASLFAYAFWGVLRGICSQTDICT